MISLTRIFTDGLLMSLILTVLIMASLWFNPRLWLQDYPADVQAKVPPKTPQEKRQTVLFGVPFFIIALGAPILSTWLLHDRTPDLTFGAAFIHAAGVFMVFNLFDALIIDGLILMVFQPQFVIIPGTEGSAGYHDIRFQVEAFLKGCVFSVVVGLLVAGLVMVVA